LVFFFLGHFGGGSRPVSSGHQKVILPPPPPPVIVWGSSRLFPSRHFPSNLFCFGYTLVFFVLFLSPGQVTSIMVPANFSPKCLTACPLSFFFPEPLCGKILPTSIFGCGPFFPVDISWCAPRCAVDRLLVQVTTESRLHFFRFPSYLLFLFPPLDFQWRAAPSPFLMLP